MRKTMILVLLGSVVGWGCGDDPPPAARRPAAQGGQAARGGGAGGPAKPGPQLVLKPKVDKAYRKEFTPADFQPDPTGDINRDPFQSYLVTPQRSGPGQLIEDECADRRVAEKYAYNELRLIGIVMRGNRNFAMFKDPSGTGQVAYQGDCLAKDKARIVEITPSCVRIEIRGIAPPGAPAPPAHEDRRCLHPEDIEVQ